MDWDDVLRLAASFFLVVTGITLAYALIRAARTLDRVSAAIDTTVKEAVPLFGKAGEALDQVSGQLATAERITKPAADAWTPPSAPRTRSPQVWRSRSPSPLTPSRPSTGRCGASRGGRASSVAEPPAARGVDMP